MVHIDGLDCYIVEMDLSKRIILNPQDAGFVLDAEYVTFLHSRANSQDDDDTLSIRCPDGDDGNPVTFHLKRSVLIRSPTFAKFFNSEHYHPNCDMLIAFVNDPAICFEIVQRYLEAGPDSFTRNSLRLFISLRRSDGDRILVLVRLCRLAKNMGLVHLTTSVFDTLSEYERFVDAEIINSAARLVFATKSTFGRALKDWCLIHVGRNLVALSCYAEWVTTLCQCEEELREEWNKMVAKNKEIIGAVRENATEADLEGMVRKMSISDQKRAMSTIEGEPARVKTFEELVMDRLKFDDDDSLSEDEWEDVGTLAAVEDRARANAQNVLSGDVDVDAFRPVGHENAKARAVMGIGDGKAERVAEGVAKGKKARGRRESIMKLLR